MSIFKGIANVGFAAIGACIVVKEAACNTGLGNKITEIKDAAMDKAEAYKKLAQASKFLKDGKINQAQFDKFKATLFPEVAKAEETEELLLIEINSL